jgi:hypothetical protein
MFARFGKVKFFLEDLTVCDYCNKDKTAEDA